jgi:hypothetical protein
MPALTQAFRVIRYDRRVTANLAFRAVPTRWNASVEGCWRFSMTSTSIRCIGADVADPANWHNQIKAVREGGAAAVVDTVIGACLTADCRERERKSPPT